MSVGELTGIAYCWGIGVPGVAHSLNTEDILLRLQERGIRTHVITPPLVGGGPPDLAATFVRCPSFSGLAARSTTEGQGPRRIAYGATEGSWLSPLAWLEAAMIRPEPMLPWAWPAARAGIRVGRQLGARFVWATYPVMTACIAGAMHARRTGLPLIIRMGDPFTGPTRSRLRALRARMERYACGSAHVLLAYTERMAAHLRGLYAPPGGVLLLQGGFDPPPDAPPPRRPNGLVTLRHIGLLYANRRPREVLEAVRLVLARRPDLVPRLRVEFIGPLHEGIRDADAYTRHDLPPSVVVFRGPVPREEARRLAREADLLLLLQHDDFLGDWTIPRKVYDYLSAGPPILGVVRNAELMELLRATGHHAFSHADVEPMSRLIERVADGHAAWPTTDPTYRAVLGNYTWDALIPKLCTAIRLAAGEIGPEEVKPADVDA